jgi:hypothetical protein
MEQQKFSTLIRGTAILLRNRPMIVIRFEYKTNKVLVPPSISAQSTIHSSTGLASHMAE